MSAEVIKGKDVAEAIFADIHGRIREAATSPGVPRLMSLSVGDKDPASQVYVKSQIKAAERSGIDFTTALLPADVTERKLLQEIEGFNSDPDLHGILIQRPLPAQIDAARVVEAIDPRKDVEGMHPLNLGALAQGKPCLTPCTAEAAVRLSKTVYSDPRGLEVVVVGHSEIVGKPIALLLVQELATITICHIGTRDLKSHTRRADLLFVAAGVPGLIEAEHVKQGAVVVDIGINRVSVKDGEETRTHIVGDVDYDAVAAVAGHITPVPGGVGPVTTAVLMQNTLKAMLLQS